MKTERQIIVEKIGRINQLEKRERQLIATIKELRQENTDIKARYYELEDKYQSKIKEIQKLLQKWGEE
jgi:hypothetical protein